MECYNSLLEDTFSHSLGLFADPSARLYGWHLLGALCLAIVYVISKSSKKRVLSLATLWTSLRHPSSFLDVKLFFFNAAFRACFILPWMLGTMLLSTSLYRVLDFCFPFHVGFFLEEETRLWAFTLISFVVADFFSFIHHYLMHTIPFLWRFSQSPPFSGSPHSFNPLSHPSGRDGLGHLSQYFKRRIGRGMFYVFLQRPSCRGRDFRGECSRPFVQSSRR